MKYLHTIGLYSGTPIIWTLIQKPWTFVVALHVICPLKSGHLTNLAISTIIFLLRDIFIYIQGLCYEGKAVHLRVHDGPINCMVACKPFSTLVTGSADRTCIVWDTNRYCILALGGHTSVHKQLYSMLQLVHILDSIVGEWKRTHFSHTAGKMMHMQDDKISKWYKNIGTLL